MPNIFFNLTSTSPTRVTGSNGPLFFRTATFFGTKSFDSSGIFVNNTSVLYYGSESGKLPMVVPAGSSSAYQMTAPERDCLGNYWVQGVSGDGVYILYN